MNTISQTVFRVIAAMLGMCFVMGTTANALTIPPRHVDFNSLTAQTHQTVYKIAPEKGLDGFGAKSRVGMKYNHDGKWIYLDTYEFRAGDKLLGVYTQAAKETPTFRAYGIPTSGTKEVNLIPSGSVSKNVMYDYVGQSDSALNATKFKDTYMEYQEDDIFIAAPSKTTKFVISFNAPADGSYDFTETLLKRASMGGMPKKYSGVTYSVVKDGKVIATVTSEKTEENLTDGQRYTLDGTVELKKGEDLLFIMEVAPENEASMGFASRIKELKLTCGSKTYNLDAYPGNDLVVTTRGYADGKDLYFWYETSFDKDPNQKSTDAFGMRAVKKNAVLTFVAPRSGTFEITAKLQRGEAGKSTVKFTKNGATLKSFDVTEKETTVTYSVVLDQDEKVNLELVYDGSGAKVYARSLSTAIKALYTGELDREYNNDGQTPLYSLAFMSDLHIDGKNPVQEIPLSSSILSAISTIKDRGGVDAILLPGDIISEGNHNSDIEKSAWNYENTISTITYLDNALAEATKTGKNIFYIAGNHEKQPGVIAEQKDPAVRIHSGSYTHWMLARTGGYYDALYMADIAGGPEYCRYPDEVLCYRYNVGGLDIIGINQPYTGSSVPTMEDRGAGQQMYPQQITWVGEQLSEIGKDKTVIIFCHYNFTTDGTSYEFKAPSQYAHLGEPVEMLIELLEQYPNAIYNYGHVHYRTEEESAHYNSSELIWNFGNKVQNADGSYTTDGYHYIHVSSIRNSATKLDPSAPAGLPTSVAQIMLVDFYEDHITFEFVNVGEKENIEGVRKMTTYTIKRDMSQLDVYSGKETSTETSEYETMTSPGITTERKETTRPTRPRPNITTIPVKKEDGKKINPLAFIIPAAVIVIGGATATALVLKKKKNK